MIMSRMEIAAASRALRNARGRIPSVTSEEAEPSAAHTAFVCSCAAQVRARPVYRQQLVMRLQRRIDAGTYRTAADEIAEQLLGRLTAAALPA